MKVLVILVLALVAVIHASPYIPGSEYYGRGGRYEQRGGGYGGGSEYDRSGYSRGDRGYVDKGYGSSGYEEGHNVRHQENEFDKSVHQRQILDQNIGGVSSGGRGGHLQSGQGGYESGRKDYGREYDRGYNYGI